MGGMVKGKNHVEKPSSHEGFVYHVVSNSGEDPLNPLRFTPPHA